MMKRWRYAVYIGFFAGLIWGLIGWTLYYFKFSSVLPAFLLEPFFRKSFMHSWSGHSAGLAAFIIYSIVAALLYTIILIKLRGPWPGVVFGLVCWGITFLWIGPFAGMLPPFRKLSMETHVTEACRFLLWGVFIGYSISLEFHDERNHSQTRIQYGKIKKLS